MWLLLLGIMSSSLFGCSVHRNRIPSDGWAVCHCRRVPHPAHPLACRWASALSPVGYCEYAAVNTGTECLWKSLLLVIPLGVKCLGLCGDGALSFLKNPALDNFRCCLATFSPPPLCDSWGRQDSGGTWLRLLVSAQDAQGGKECWFYVGNREKCRQSTKSLFFRNSSELSCRPTTGLKSGKTGASGRGTCLPGATLDRKSCQLTDAGHKSRVN